MSEQVNGVVEAMYAEVQKVVGDFALKPTNSGRLKLQQEFRKIATALEIEAGAGDFNADEQSVVLRAVDVLRELSEQALYVDHKELAEKFDVKLPGPKTREKARANTLTEKRVARAVQYGARFLRSLFK